MKNVLLAVIFTIINSVSFATNYLFFDTETTGLPADYEAPSSDTANWPRLVQLSWILTDNQGNHLSAGDYIITPKGFVIPTQASDIHKITTDTAIKYGVNLDYAISKFLSALDSAEYIVGHNISFDIHVVDAELVRLGLDEVLYNKKAYCTMIASTDYCKLPGMYGNYKWPKLSELHKKLFDCDFEGAHNSATDIFITCKCFWEMRKRKII